MRKKIYLKCLDVSKRKCSNGVTDGIESYVRYLEQHKRQLMEELHSADTPNGNRLIWEIAGFDAMDDLTLG